MSQAHVPLVLRGIHDVHAVMFRMCARRVQHVSMKQGSSLREAYAKPYLCERCAAFMFDHEFSLSIGEDVHFAMCVLHARYINVHVQYIAPCMMYAFTVHVHDTWLGT